MLRRFLFAGAACLTLGGLTLFAGSAAATEYGYGCRTNHCQPAPRCDDQPSCRYETVTCYETRQVPYAVCVTRYDECGRAYHVNVTRYRCVRVPVTRQVPVCNYN
jgi:hypothetical protein